MGNSNPAATAVCPICKERFVRGRYGNRYGSGERIEAQRFCGPACRQRAYRDRRDIENNVSVSARRRRPSKVRLYPRAVTQRLAETPKEVGLPLVAGSVTRAEIPQQIQGPATPQKNQPPGSTGASAGYRHRRPARHHRGGVLRPTLLAVQRQLRWREDRDSPTATAGARCMNNCIPSSDLSVWTLAASGKEKGKK